MPLLVNWLYEDVLISSIGVGKVSTQDAHDFLNEALYWMEHSTAQYVHNIIDLRHIEPSFETGILRELSAATKIIRHPKVGWSLMISTDRAANFITGTLLKMTGSKFKASGDPAEILTFAQQLVPDIANVPTLEAYNAFVEECLVAYRATDDE